MPTWSASRTYVWNGQISLEIARRLKALKPGIVVVFGGPHVPDQPEAFLRANPQIDLAVHNEGERTFLKLLEAWPDRDAWAALPGVVDGPGRRRVRAQPQHRPRARSRRDPVAVPGGRVRRHHGRESRRELDRPVGDQPRLPVPLHLLRLGFGDRRQGHQVRRGAALPRGRLVRRAARSSTSSAATPTSASRSATSTSPTTSPT